MASRGDWRWTFVFVALLAAMLATALMPALRRTAPRTARTHVAETAPRPLTDFPPPMPAMSIGDHYYEWSHAVCPTGRYRPPDASGSGDQADATRYGAACEPLAAGQPSWTD